jgi:hypothetical protein
VFHFFPPIGLFISLGEIMEWQSELVSVYLSVCDAWQKGCSETVRRYSNNNSFAITDEEIVTLYLFGIISGNSSVRSIYNYANRHLREWFPCLGGYESFSYRLNKISDGFVSLCQEIGKTLEVVNPEEWVVDSLPVIMAGPKRSGKARVAPELANKGYCASKDLYYYGVKVHVVGNIQSGTIPIPSFIGLAPASNNDFRMLQQVSPELLDGTLFGDLAYADSDHTKSAKEQQNLRIITPNKKKKGLHSFPGGDTYSSWVSSIRQPIESFFNWLQEKTKIQNASKVRSSAGLMVHVFGRITAAMMLMNGFYAG